MIIAARTRLRLAISILTLALASGCASVDLEQPKDASYFYTGTQSTHLGEASATWRTASPNQNGFYPLIYGMDAFGARLKMMDWAARSIDAQYFLMKPDVAGIVFSTKLYQAAERGVRVRLLIDDIFTTVDDRMFVLLNDHPNIELRIFNPISRRGLFALNYAGHFRLANRRMHNKSFIVDNQMAIVGGRNIAKEYFQLDASGEFIDFDMLSAGPVVNVVSAAFDRYWNHALAVPFEQIYTRRDEDEMRQLRDKIVADMREAGDSVYASAIHTKLINDLVSGDLAPIIADAEVVVDDPEKLMQAVSVDQKIVANRLADAVLDAQEEVIVFTPYFIPSERSLDIMDRVVANGVRIILITNSLASNNHTAVHSSYSSYRKRLLEAGVELWEARADAGEIIRADGSRESEHLTLHTKGVIIDRKLTFVGSLNLDPRSIDIDSETGLLIHSPELGGALAEAAMERIPGIAYRLLLDADDHLTWHAVIDGEKVVETTEPNASLWRRFTAWVLKIAPEGQL
ncbi:MAG: phospholipase D family protein [Woeseiaceae bacterium]